MKAVIHEMGTILTRAPGRSSADSRLLLLNQQLTIIIAEQTIEIAAWKRALSNEIGDRLLSTIQEQQISIIQRETQFPILGTRNQGVQPKGEYGNVRESDVPSTQRNNRKTSNYKRGTVLFGLDNYRLLVTHERFGNYDKTTSKLRNKRKEGDKYNLFI